MTRPSWLHRPRWPRLSGIGKAAGIRQGQPVTPAKLRGDLLVRLATVLTVAAVAGVAAYVSFWHAVEVVEHHGERGIIGHLYPVLIDGIVIAASMVVLDAARHLEAAPKLAWSLLLSGIGVTVVANVSYGVLFGLSGALWAAWPAFAFVGCFELLMMLVRASARRADPIRRDAFPSPVPPSAEAAAEASLRTTLAAGNPLSTNQLVERYLLTRTAASKLRTRVLAGSNGHPSADTADTDSADTTP